MRILCGIMGKIIVFDGTPLAGKTTQAEKLADYLNGEVSLLKRVTEYCPTRERINELREKADGYTRDVISVEEETKIWKKYYEEKNAVINKHKNEFDYVIADRYYLSLIPTQQIALEIPIIEFLDEHKSNIKNVKPDILFFFTVDSKEEIRRRYANRENEEMSDEHLEEIWKTQQNYLDMMSMFEHTHIETSNKSVDEVEDIVLDRIEDVS